MGNCCGATVNAWPHKRVENRLSSNLVYDQKHKSVFDKYEVVRGIGVGSIGLVRAVKIKGDTSDRQYALKSLRVGRFTSDFVQEMEQEIAVIRNLDHPNIARAFEVYRERRNIHLVMELCSGGDLYQRQPYSEHQAAIITVKLLSAIKYMVGTSR
jgi:serine/threonine protein kinase